MTVVAWDGHTLAADKRSSQSWGAHDTVTKIERHGDALLAVTGNGSVALRIAAWWKAGADPTRYPPEADKDDGGNLIVFRPNQPIQQFGRGPFPTPVENPRNAWGCGADFAIAAMHCGRDAREAVEIACIYNTQCGNGIDTLTLESTT